VTVVAELREVRKRFGATEALDCVDIRIRAGETLVVLGANGAGKTTAIRVLLGLRRPDSGRATLFGVDPHRRQARVRCGATPQETDLPETLRVRELLDFVRAHFPRPTSTGALLSQFGLEELAGRQTGGLSGGERRRVAVALAFAGDPELVFLDEPSAGLDLDSRRRLWDAIRAFASRGRSILLTTHDLVEAEALASRVVLLERGRVVLEGTVEEIAKRAGLQSIRLRSQPLPHLPVVERVVRNGRFLLLYTRAADAVVRDLVYAGTDLAEVEIRTLSLEQALELEPSG
jgi:ABC-2 type transport system ATP-binding protein